jgi:hypothetical protein
VFGVLRGEEFRRMGRALGARLTVQAHRGAEANGKTLQYHGYAENRNEGF